MQTGMTESCWWRRVKMDSSVNAFSVAKRSLEKRSCFGNCEVFRKLHAMGSVSNKVADLRPLACLKNDSVTDFA